MKIIIGIMAGIILVLVIILWRYQRQVKDICRQLTFLNENDSNMMLSREMDFGGIGRLTDILNDMLFQRRKERSEYMEKEKAISDTYTSLSHDIRTPLTSLDGYFQLLEESKSRQEQEKYIRVIQERIGSLKEMLEELFTYTKLKNASYHIELKKCMVNRIVKDAVFSYYEDWKQKGIEPELQITKEPLYMDGNVQAFRRVVQNIIKNGLEHGEKRIRIVLARRDGKICLQIGNPVQNPQEIDVDRVFEQFYKADTRRSKSSSGLGLPIAKELVLQMKGNIDAKLEGEDFTVEIEFPEKRRLKQ